MRLTAKGKQKQKTDDDFFMSIYYDLWDSNYYYYSSSMDGWKYIFSWSDLVYQLTDYRFNKFNDLLRDGEVMLSGLSSREYYFFPDEDRQYEWIEELELYDWECSY